VVAEDARFLVCVVHGLAVSPSRIFSGCICGIMYGGRLGCGGRKADYASRARERAGTVARSMSMFVSCVVWVARQLAR
jgi:hypothetical protein